MASPGNRHCANFIGALSFPVASSFRPFSGDFSGDFPQVKAWWSLTAERYVAVLPADVRIDRVTPGPGRVPRVRGTSPTGPGCGRSWRRRRASRAPRRRRRDECITRTVKPGRGDRRQCGQRSTKKDRRRVISCQQNSSTVEPKC